MQEACLRRERDLGGKGGKWGRERGWKIRNIDLEEVGKGVCQKFATSTRTSQGESVCVCGEIRNIDKLEGGILRVHTDQQGRFPHRRGEGGAALHIEMHARGGNDLPMKTSRCTSLDGNGKGWNG